MAKKKVTDPVVSSVATRASPNGIHKGENVPVASVETVPQRPPPTLAQLLGNATQIPESEDVEEERAPAKRIRIAVSQPKVNL